MELADDLAVTKIIQGGGFFEEKFTAKFSLQFIKIDPGVDNNGNKLN